MIAGLALVALLAAALTAGWVIGARAAHAHNRIEALIAADTRDTFVDDVAELAMDDEPAGEVL